MDGYFRVQYKGNKYGYWEDIEPYDEDEKARLFETAEVCRMQGALPKEHPLAVGYIESLCQSDTCPPVFHGVGDDDEVMTVYVELRTVSRV